MTDATPNAADMLIRLLRTSLTPDGAPSFNQLVLYTSFGVVRGRIGYGFAQELKSQESAGPRLSESLIELNAVTVEHFSNHLASAAFDRLYVRLDEVKGFAFIG
ncbi:MAG TPA: hypothetical protein VKA60_16630 [Blastocatellia bacterium]|nr:hypothetical protein [Blastocatellia bacterium]